MKLKKIYSPISKELLHVNLEIRKHLQKLARGQKNVDKIIKYFFSMPGKLLRPALVIFSAGVCNLKISRSNHKLILLGLIVEFIHSASLIHDDILDGSPSRRGQITLNRKFSNQIAVLAGDILYTYSLTQLMNNFDKKFLELFIKCIENMCQGEIYNLNNKITSYKEYLEIIIKKTALLMSAGCAAGAMHITKDSRMISACKKFGLNYGIAFQLVDDHIDHETPETLKIDNMKKAREYIQKAKKCITILKESEYKTNLINLADYVIFRGENSNSNQSQR